MIYLPLVPDSKLPAVKGWADPEYAGVTPDDGWVGLRADGLVIIDCDTKAAAKEWRDNHAETLTVKTPRGFHFYYQWTPGSPTGPHVGVLPNVDVRAGRGSYVVAPPTPGYQTVHDVDIAPFDPSWTPKPQTKDTSGEGWNQIPDGQRNATLAAFGGSLRKQGMAPKEIARTLMSVNVAYCEPPLEREEVVNIAKSVGRYAPDPDEGGEIVVVTDTMTPLWWGDMKLPPPPEWWWKPYLPKGRLVFLDGREGIGKGMFCTWLAACIVKGVRPGDGSPDTPGNVLWLPAEDDPEEDILRRLYAAGAAPDKVPGRIAFLSDDTVRLPEKEAELIQLIKTTEARLVILDPGRAFLGPAAGHDGRDFSYNNEAHVRPGMQACLRIAKATGATIMFVHHWNKNVGGEINYRASGSGAFNQVVRHRITIARVEDDGRINGAFAITKSNIIDVGHVHGYTLEEVPKWDTATFVLTDKQPDGSLDEWEKRAKDGKLARKIKPAHRLETWLCQQMYGQGDPVPRREEIEKTLDMSQAEARQALAGCRDAGLLGQNGKGPLSLLRTPAMWMGEG